MATTRLLTVGHGTLGADDLAALLEGAAVERLVDVRSYPGSRRHPHFGRDQMAVWLPEAGTGYRWEPRLGGRRRPRPDSPHTALRHQGFRAYADHMAGEEFTTALDELLDEASGTVVAVMCAESLWWKCHRRLLADAVTLAHDGEVLHLRHDGRLDHHRPTEGARAAGDGRLVYDEGGNRRLPGLGGPPEA